MRPITRISLAIATSLLLMLMLLFSVPRVHAAITATFVKGPFNGFPAAGGGAQYDFASVSVFIDPSLTNWIALSRLNNLADIATGANGNIPPDGILDIQHMSSDDFVRLTVTKGAASATIDLDKNGSVNQRIGNQAVIFGFHPSVWAVTQVIFSAPPVTFSATFPETGALTSFFNANGAGVYTFNLSFRNDFTQFAGHGNVWLLVDAEEPALDHFLVHKVQETEGTPEFVPLTVTLTDQFESKSFEVKEPNKLYNPADKNSEGISDPDTHLVGYKIMRAKGEPVHVKRTNIKVENQFGVLFVDTIKPDSLLVPTAKSLGPGPAPAPLDPETVDHFKCYKIKVTAGTPEFVPLTVSLTDQFESGSFQVKKPKSLCNPVEKLVGAGPPVEIKNPDDHLVCYEVEQVVVADIHVNNQFGPLQLETRREKELCVPSKKTLPTP